MPRYNSLHADPRAEALNCFSQDWTEDINWCHPPVDQLDNLVRDSQGFIVNHNGNEDKLLLIPSGFVVLSTSAIGSQCLRWVCRAMTPIRSAC